MGLSSTELLEIYRKLRTIRSFEEKDTLCLDKNLINQILKNHYILCYQINFYHIVKQILLFWRYKFGNFLFSREIYHQLLLIFLDMID